MKLPLNQLLLIALVVLVTLQVDGCFKKTPANEKLIRAEEKIKQVEQKRQSDSLINEAFLKVKNDSIALLQEQLIANGTKLQVNKISYDKIKPIVIDYSREQLRTEASRYLVPAN
jgi:hypothetical protein